MAGMAAGRSRRVEPSGLVQYAMHATVALVDDHVLLPAVGMEEVPPDVPWQLASLLHAATAVRVCAELLHLRGVPAREQLVLGVRMAGFARAAVVSVLP